MASVRACCLFEPDACSCRNLPSSASSCFSAASRPRSPGRRRLRRRAWRVRNSVRLRFPVRIRPARSIRSRRAGRPSLCPWSPASWSFPRFRRRRRIPTARSASLEATDDSSPLPPPQPVARSAKSVAKIAISSPRFKAPPPPLDQEKGAYSFFDGSLGATLSSRSRDRGRRRAGRLSGAAARGRPRGAQRCVRRRRVRRQGPSAYASGAEGGRAAGSRRRAARKRAAAAGGDARVARGRRRTGQPAADRCRPGCHRALRRPRGRTAGLEPLPAGEGREGGPGPRQQAGNTYFTLLEVGSRDLREIEADSAGAARALRIAGRLRPILFTLSNTAIYAYFNGEFAAGDRAARAAAADAPEQTVATARRQLAGYRERAKFFRDQLRRATAELHRTGDDLLAKPLKAYRDALSLNKEDPTS